MIKEEIRIDNEENSLYAEKADIDGFHICECEGKHKIYVYYSEIEKMEQLLRKIKYIRDKKYKCEKQPIHSSGNTSNAKTSYKDFGSYNRYIKSDTWKQKRAERKKLDGNKCKSCGSNIRLQVHHKNYCSFGNEDVKKDLVTLCDECHDKKTLLSRKKRRGVVTDFS